MHGTVATTTGTVLCHGCWDLLHLGHIRHLQEARRMGSRLVVSVTADRFVNKGNGRPHFSQSERADARKALECVDDVYICDAPDATLAISVIQPSLYVKGVDYNGVNDPVLDKEIAAVQSYGGGFHVTNGTKWSSSGLLKGFKFSLEVLAYLDQPRVKGFRDSIHAAFGVADTMKLAFIGETIIDEYRYVSSLGKPAKEFILATVERSKPDVFLGGASAAFMHADWNDVTLVTDDGCHPIKKTRFVDVDFSRKLFEVYSRQTLNLDEKRRGKFQASLIKAMRDCDAAVLFDFGHGLMGPAERHIAESAKFLAVNAQSNAGNWGFNKVTKYLNPSYVCVDEPEARLATGLQHAAIEDVIEQLGMGLLPRTKLAITHGRYGCHFHDAERLGSIPPFVTTGIDTMGAGDAFLAVSGPLIAAGLDLEAAAFAGNVAGAIKVGILGHERHVRRDELLQTVDALLA